MQQRVGRRGFLKTSAAGIASLVIGSQLSGCRGGDFEHGVASGDPSADALVIWTRVTPSESGDVTVLWEVARDEQFVLRVAAGLLVTDASVDHTVKVDVHGLRPGQTYFYRFRTSDARSPVGRGRTLPVDQVQQAKLAVVSCAHFIQGYFHVYRELALRDDLDLVLHLGDYIYESGNSATLGIRQTAPNAEVFDLAGYRQRYAHYRSDPDLQAAHAKHSFALVWDDHEVANNAWQGGALGHDDAAEGSYTTRRAAAFQAYHEWLPVREPVDGERQRLFRRCSFGDLATLHLLDTRHYAREQALNIVDYVNPQTGAIDEPRLLTDIDAPRALLGEEQQSWLAEGLADGATWQLLAQQILLAPMWLPAPIALRQLTFAQYAALQTLAQNNPGALTAAQRRLLAQPAIPYNLDGWDGYAAERRTLLEQVEALDIDLIVLAGDTHNAWASDIVSDDGAPLAVELACPSISSRGLDELLAPQDPLDVAAGALARIERLRYAEAGHRGWLTVTLTPTEARAVWSFVDTVKTLDYQLVPALEQRLRVLPGQRVLLPDS